jgi:hypothetical protein
VIITFDKESILSKVLVWYQRLFLKTTSISCLFSIEGIYLLVRRPNHKINLRNLRLRNHSLNFNLSLMIMAFLLGRFFTLLFKLLSLQAADYMVILLVVCLISLSNNYIFSKKLINPINCINCINCIKLCS